MRRKIPETITEQEFIDIFKATKHKHHQLAFALGFYNCLRISEIVKLKPENIDYGRKLLIIKEAKGKKDRNIPIAKEVYSQLKYLPIKCKIRALELMFKKMGLKILNKNLYFHQLRHSGATYYYNIKKWDIRNLQVFLGHSKLDTTQIYTHVNPEDLTKLIWN